MDYQRLTEQVLADERYRKNIEFEYKPPHPGHPEGKVKNHIAELEVNLERLKPRLPNEEIYWKLKFLIHVHDTFKADAIRTSVPATHPRSHESLARAFASEFTDDYDLLTTLQFHDENYTLWKQFQTTGCYDEKAFHALLDAVHDWDLYLIFTIIDGQTKGKDIAKLTWFIEQVRKHKQTIVDSGWVVLS